MITTIILALSFSLQAQAQIPRSSMQGETPAEDMVLIDSGIARGLSSQFANPKQDEVGALIARRAAVCKQAHAQCIDNSKWAKWSCTGGFEPILGMMYQLWSTSLAEMKTEKEAQALWATVTGCSKKLTGVQAAIGLLTAKAVFQKGYSKLLSAQIFPWVKANFAQPPVSPEFGFNLLSQGFQDIRNVRPRPYDLLSQLVSVLGAWTVPPGTKLPPGALAEWVKALAQIQSVTGKRSQVPDFVDRYQMNLEPADLQRSWQVADEYCHALRDLGDTARCEAFFKRRFPGSAHPVLELERALNRAEIGDLDGALAQVGAVMTQTGGNRELEFMLKLAMAGFQSHKGDQALALKTATGANYPGMTETQRVDADVLLAAISRRSNKPGDAQKLLSDLRAFVKSNVSGPFTYSQKIEYESLLLALQGKDAARVRSSLASLKRLLTGDASESFYKEASAAVEKKLARQDTAAEITAIERVNGKNNPRSVEFKKLLDGI